MPHMVHTVTVIAVAAALATLAAMRTTAAGGQAGPAFRTGVNLVALNVTVQDAGSRLVTGLQPRDFAIYEDGVKQELRFFESASVPIDLIVLLDKSTSMADKLGQVTTAARGFLDTLRPGDRGAVVAFADRVEVRQPLTSDRAALASAVRLDSARGNTALYGAVYVALKHFGGRVGAEGTVRRQAIVMLSDGEDTSSLLSFDDVLAVARQTGINIYTVRLRARYPEDPQAVIESRPSSEADFEMNRLARETGALSFFPSPDRLQTVYASIAAEIASQYSVGYEPERQGRDGRFRQVSVQIVNRPNLRARTRAGYTMGPVRAVGTH